VVHSASRSCRTSNWIGIDFAESCASYGFPLNAPTVTLSGTVGPSGGSQTNSATTESPQDPPTGLPSSFLHGSSAASPSGGGGPTTTSSKASQVGPTSSTTASHGGSSGAVRVVNTAEVICVVFGVCLAAVLMA
jgi:hypothetical protein